MKKTTQTIWFCLLGAMLVWTACATEKKAENDAEPMASEPMEPKVDDEGYTVLFDGSSMAGWHIFQKEGTEGWAIEDGAMTLKKKGAGDIVTDQEYENFDLKLEWKISENGNSGIMYHVSEDPKYKAPYHTGPEMQVLDNDGHPDGKIHMHRAGDNYDLHAADPETVKPVGEWNEVQLIVNQGKVEHWLNGTKVVEFEIGSDDWEARLAKSKFTQWPDYSRMGKGVICLQDHGDPVWFRNIRIKEL
jgi:hypothetical protein